MAELYKYQKHVDALLRTGRSIILQAPTGAGKTRAALFPFLDGLRNEPAAFPTQCLYAVPMRVLANQFEAEYKETVARYKQSHGLYEVKGVAVQTGARPEDREFTSDLVFMTIDQLLSSFLAIPYSLSLAKANLNAGAVIGSYLVFDEFHLFPVNGQGEGALTTTLDMLQMLTGVTPFVLMTATFSKTMIARLARLLDAEPFIVSETWLDDIPSQHGKRRSFTRCADTLKPAAVWDDVQRAGRDRVIAICNTVPRAQALAAGLLKLAAGSDVHIEVLHSQFFRSDDPRQGWRGRDTKEATIRREFGEDTALHTWPRAILVATQVVEVGLNITSSALHTEIAPMAAVIQRAGRCARFRGEAGDVFVYDVPATQQGQPDYAPYLDEGQEELCARSWQALEGFQHRVLAFDDELTLVDEVHNDYDTHMLDRLERDSSELRRKIATAWGTRDYSKGRALIRDVDSRTVLIHPDPSDKTIREPYAWEGLSMRPRRLLAWWRAAQEAGKDLDWMVKYPHTPQQVAIQEAEQLRTRRIYEWRTLRQGDGGDELRTADPIVIHPRLVSYDDVFGLRLDPGDVVFAQAGPDTSINGRRGDGPYSYQRETYAEHIARLYQVYRTDLYRQTAAAQARLAARLQLAGSAASLDRAICLMIAAHDLGKLNKPWQDWARAWQTWASQRLHSRAKVEPPDYMYAHTDYDGDDPAQREHNNKMGKRPNHAAESAWAAWHLLAAISTVCPVDDCTERNPLLSALATAIARHHVALVEGNVVAFVGDHGGGTGHHAARTAFAEALHAVGLTGLAQLPGPQVQWSFTQGPKLAHVQVDPSSTDEMLLYLLLVRILRLCDQGALALQG